MDRFTRFRVRTAPRELRSWVLAAFAGVKHYFPLPEETSIEEVSRVLEWKAYDGKRREFEDLWSPRVAALFTKAGREIAKQYAATRSVQSLEGPLYRELLVPLGAMLRKLQDEVGVAFARRLRSRLRQKNDPFEEIVLEDLPEMQSYFNSMTAAKVTNIGNTTRTLLRNIIDKAVRDGDSVPEIVDKIQAGTGFSRYRSYLIARTEVIGASNAGTHFGIGKFQPTNGMTKDWLATNDKRTRPTHRRAGADQKGIAYDKPFQVGGSLLMFPGDPSLGASAKEIIQCRCTSLYFAPPLDFLTNPKPTPPPPPSPKPPRVPRVPKVPKPPKPPKTPLPRPLGDPEKLRAEFLTATDAIESRVAAIVLEREALMREMVALEARLGNGVIQDSEFLRLNSANQKLREEIEKLREIRRNSFRDLFLKYAESEERGTLKTVIRGKGLNKAVVKEAEKFLNRIIGGRPELRDLRIEVKTTPSGRAYQKTVRKFNRATLRYEEVHQVYLDPLDDIGTAVHEIAHAIERTSKTVNDAVNALWDRRTAGENFQKLRDVTGNSAYRDTELTKVDQWMSPYMGKVYRVPNQPGGLTELTSMGLEYFFRDPARLMRQDPELFDVIFRALRATP
jgi:hypothetical protein